MSLPAVSSALPPLPQLPLPKYQRILVIRYRFIGDTILLIPFLKALHAAFPQAEIDVLVGPASGEVLAQCPYIHQLIYFDTTRKHRYEATGENQSDRPSRSFWSYVQELSKNHYDVAYVLKRSLSSAVLAFLSGIPRRVGFNTECRRWFLTKAVSYDKHKPEHECFLDVLRADGVPVTFLDEAPEMEKSPSSQVQTSVGENSLLAAWWGPEDEAMAAAMFEKYQGFTNVLVHFTSSNPGKLWPQKACIELVQWLVSENSNVRIHTLGTSGDAPVYEAIRQALPEEFQNHLLNWCGHTGLLESLAFLNKMDFMIGVDSGTLHMAASVQTPVIALFGPMDDQKWGPVGEGHQIIAQSLPCRPCHLKVPCSIDFECMKSLPVEKVKAACMTLLKP
ncbi:MAG: lipopolysaccharide heptosyltransferase II [Cyanobacteria bacterium]|nr:lipopolysaccharide heptosyltransferase II [Cyanobacteriota bacterium]